MKKIIFLFLIAPLSIWAQQMQVMSTGVIKDYSPVGVTNWTQGAGVIHPTVLTSNVAIGTTTSTDLLTAQSATAQPTLMVSNGGNAAFSPLIGVKHAGTRNGYLGIDPVSKNLFLLNYGSGTLTQGNNTNLKSSLVLTDDGKIGIGEIAPKVRLHVNNGFTSGLTSTFSNAALALTGTSTPRIYFEDTDNATGQRVMSIAQNGTGGLSFEGLSDNAGAATVPNILTVANSGFVGIGTGAPTTKLEVIGKTKTDQLQVSTGAGFDKVLVSDALGNATWQTSNSVTSSSALATPNLATFVLGQIEFRISAGRNLEMRSATAATVIVSCYGNEQYPSIPTPSGYVYQSAVLAATGGLWTNFIAGTADTNEMLTYKVYSDSTFYTVNIANRAGTVLLLQASK